MPGRRLITHGNCKPADQNPKGILRSMYYNTKQTQVFIEDYKFCDGCKKIIKFTQREIN